MTSLWHRFVERGGSSRRGAIVQALLHEHVRTHAPTSEEHTGPGIVFFDAVSQPVCDLVRESSRNGLERVLAVATLQSVLTGNSVWRLLHSGASDVFAWDHSTQPAREIAERFERWQSVDRVVASPVVRNNLVGSNPAWISMLRQMVEVASFTDASVLITGESGTGKELVSRLIHSLDAQRQKRDLVVLDCTTIVSELSGSEFFGHERGAFTGAVAARDGAFALASGGTLFLDEVGELPLTLQAELLRVVQERTYKRVGSNVWQQTDFRLVCATNRDLLHEESQGRFRRDLYYRIAAWTCKLPGLRERPEDILPLAQHFLRQLRPNQEPEMDQAVKDYLCQRAYPGNVRDLKQVVSRMSYRHVGPGPLTAGDIPQEERPSLEAVPSEWQDGSFEAAIGRAVGMGIGVKEISHTAVDTAIRMAVASANGNLARAARQLGVTDRALQMRRAARRKGAHGKESDAAPGQFEDSA
ncbi:MAG TPA: sigma 54-interacting transcriptional regulator [Candidatus Polarisedimenticolia bacterium]|nr:sigma 54-interacting transcriptional regulator [Candidatus Polarisedimenticolia bacterium]